MTIHLTASVVVTIVGALVYALVPGKAAELGRIAFGVGLLACLVFLR